MKIGFLSDTHGGYANTLKALDILKDCDIIYHMGDVLYHGPRNALPYEYKPKELAAHLKTIDKIVYIRGNCDADVDEMVLEKDLSDFLKTAEHGNLKFLLSHGYRESENELIQRAKEKNANIIVRGHTHIKEHRVKDGIILLNPGSTTIPKDGSASVMKIYHDKAFFIKLDNLEQIVYQLKN